jgi:hypothetical protein
VEGGGIGEIPGYNPEVVDPQGDRGTGARIFDVGERSVLIQKSVGPGEVDGVVSNDCVCIIDGERLSGFGAGVVQGGEHSVGVDEPINSGIGSALRADRCVRAVPPTIVPKSLIPYAVVAAPVIGNLIDANLPSVEIAGVAPAPPSIRCARPVWGLPALLGAPGDTWRRGRPRAG